MKKRIIFVLFIIIVLFVSLGIYIKTNQNKESEDHQRNTLIVVNLYYNNAWTRICCGRSIFNDRSI